MTITNIMENVYKIYDGETGALDNDSEDFQIRLALANQAINVWETQEGMVWNELFTTESGTTADSDYDYDLSSNFISPAGFLRIYDANNNATIYKYKRPEEFYITQDQESNTRMYTITGGDGSRVLIINPTPSTASGTAGLTYKLDYYKRATTYSTGEESTEIEMSDPWFVIHWILAQLYADDENTTKLQIHQPIATQKLSNMRIRNEVNPFGNPNALQDTTWTGFGV